MATRSKNLSPEFVTNKGFTVIKHGDGYDIDEVDDFLDLIASDLRQRDVEVATLARAMPRIRTTVPMSPPLAPEGWYPDPAGQAFERRWNGAKWTDETR